MKVHYGRMATFSNSGALDHVFRKSVSPTDSTPVVVVTEKEWKEREAEFDAVSKRVKKLESHILAFAQRHAEIAVSQSEQIGYHESDEELHDVMECLRGIRDAHLEYEAEHLNALKV